MSVFDFVKYERALSLKRPEKRIHFSQSHSLNGLFVFVVEKMKVSWLLLHLLLFVCYAGKMIALELKSFHGKTGWEVVETSE